MKPPLNHMMLNNDALADGFNTILGYRTTHSGLVLPAAASYTRNKVSFNEDATADGLRVTSGLNSQIAANASQTFSVWFTPTSATTGRIFQIMYLDSPGNGGLYVDLFRLSFIAASRKLQFAVWNEDYAVGLGSGGDYDIAATLSTSALTLNQEYHVAVKYTVGAACDLYINGVQDATAASLASVATDFTAADEIDIAIGQVALGTANKLPCYLSDLMWNNSDIDIAPLYNGGAGVDYGADGSGVLGLQPKVLLTGNNTAWATNKGTVTGLTVVGAIGNVA